MLCTSDNTRNEEIICIKVNNARTTLNYFEVVSLAAGSNLTI